jgi:hypothetical protein
MVSERRDVGFVFTIETRSDNDDKAWQLAQEFKKHIHDAVVTAIEANFRGASLGRFEIGRGSINIIVEVLGAYTLISHYDDFIKSLDTFARQVEEFLRTLFELFPGMTVISGYSFMPPKTEKRSGLPNFLSWNRDVLLFMVVGYLIISHAFC